MNSSRLKLTTWIAFADFFAAISLFMFAHYAVQRRKVIVIGKPVKDFAAELHKQLVISKVEHEWDESQSWLTLPDDYFLFEKGRWAIGNPRRVATLALALKSALRGTPSAGVTTSGPAFRFYLMIRGHADARPMRGITNMELSKRRSRALEEALIRFGVSAPEFQVSSQGVGETEPLADNCAEARSDAGRSILMPPCPNGVYAPERQLRRNRRIELRFGVFAAK